MEDDSLDKSALQVGDDLSKAGPRQSFLHYFVFFAFGLSGAAALIYEVVWTRKLSMIMGSSTYALSTTLAAFMMGLALGGMLGGLWVPRIKHHLRMFAFCELGIGLSPWSPFH